VGAFGSDEREAVRGNVQNSVFVPKWTTPRGFGALAEGVDVEAERLDRGGDGERLGQGGDAGRLRGEVRRIALEEVWTSAALAGSSLSYDETAALVERGVAIGGRRLEDYVLTADYAAAARFAANAPPAGRRRIFLRMEEIVALHAIATRREPGARPGAWRTTTAPAFASGVVPPPAWLVPREMAAFVERIASGPASHPHRLVWIADAHERFARIHPFSNANGRAVRLLTNLLLARIGLPPFAVRGVAIERYHVALRRADARDLWPLATVLARAVLASLRRLTAASDRDADLQPLATFATGARRAALYKAAQRGRLRSVRRAGRLLTSAAWLAEYEGRHPGSALPRA